MAEPIGNRFARTVVVADGKSESRRKLVIAMRAAANRLGLSDDDRRALFEQVTGKRSSTDMTFAEMGRVLDHLNKGWKGPQGHRAHIGKIRALWWNLYFLAEIDANDRTVERALDAFVKRQTGLDSLKFVNHRAAPSVIEALKSWCTRAGVRWPTADQASGYGTTLAIAERVAVADAIWNRLVACGEVKAHTPYDYVRSAIGLHANHWGWSAREWDAGIRLIGKKLQHAKFSGRAA